MHWLIFVLILVMVIGPIMYMVPTERDKRLMQLRMKARQLGMNIEISTLPKLDPTADERVTASGQVKSPTFSCSGYQLPVSNDDALATFRLQRIPQSPTMLVNEVAGWHATTADGSEQIRLSGDLAGLENFLRSLPDTWSAVALDARFLTCFWDEKASADSDILESMVEVLREFETVSARLRN